MNHFANVRTFALIGLAGYVAPRHLQAIRAVGGDLKAAVDPADSVGVIDSYFPDACFFVEFGRFDRYVDKLRRTGEPVEYVSICSPNYLHDYHVRFALHSGAHAICEKPLVLNPRNVEALAELAQSTGMSVNTILQLRLHPRIQTLRQKVASGPPDKVYEIDVRYIAPRGSWYHVSWKGDPNKSGGIATNIGIHLFDMLVHVFGPVTRNIVHHHAADRAAGYLECRRARVRWFLSTNRADLPEEARRNNCGHRSITVDGEELEFTKGLNDLHTRSYEAILSGEGFGIDEVRPSIEIVSHIRSAPAEPGKDEQHPLMQGVARDG